VRGSPGEEAAGLGVRENLAQTLKNAIFPAK
jgi:hypothetical protein